MRFEEMVSEFNLTVEIEGRELKIIANDEVQFSCEPSVDFSVEDLMLDEDFVEYVYGFFEKQLLS